MHADAVQSLRSIDGTIEALVDCRLACLDVLVDCRDQLRPRWGNRHSRRRASVDEGPFPEAPDAAKPLEGVELRSVAITILRRHGAQRLRDLHAIIHLYGYRIHGNRPVQRLGDAMAYELRQGRVERLERGVYGPAESDRGPVRYAPPESPLSGQLPWDRPITEPGPPLLDPDLAQDPELWSGARWPTADDLPDDPDEPPSSDHDGATAEPPRPAAAPPDPATHTDPPTTLGGDSSTNRRPATSQQERRWEPPP